MASFDIFTPNEKIRPGKKYSPWMLRERTDRKDEMDVLFEVRNAKGRENCARSILKVRLKSS